MRFREYYNSIEELHKCHAVIEREVENLAQNATKFWRLLEKYMDEQGIIIHADLKQKYSVLKGERLSLLTVLRNIPDIGFCREFEPGIEKTHKEDAEMKLKEDYMKEYLAKTEQDMTRDHHSSIADLPLFYVDATSRTKESPDIDKGTEIVENQISQNEVETENLTEEVVNVETHTIDQETMDVDRAADTTTSISDVELLKQVESMDENIEIIDRETVQLNVLVHGLQGKHEDMARLMIYLDEHMPQSISYCSRSNEMYPDSELYLMGRRLAEELQCVLKELSKVYKVCKMNFIGHSTGRLLFIRRISH